MLLTWWIGDAIGIIATAPALLALFSWWVKPPPFTSRNFIRAALWLTLVVTVLSIVFLNGNGSALVLLIFFMLVVAHVLIGGNAVKITVFILVSGSILAVKLGAWQFAAGGFKAKCHLLWVSPGARNGGNGLVFASGSDPQSALNEG